MGPQHILKLQPAFALWQECGSKAFWTAVSDCMERPKVRNLYVSVAGSLIAKQPQPWTRRLSATAGLFEQTDSRLLAIETPSSPGMTPPGGRLSWRSAVENEVCWMSRDCISRGRGKSLSRAGPKSTEFQFIHSCANAAV